jgi:predicted dienelactone hydrolase
VIVFSHGSVDLPIDYYITLERIAALGFIVAGPAHVNNTSDDARIDYLNTVANRTVLSCFDGLPSPCSRANILDSMVDRSRDIGAVLDALPMRLGLRANMDRVGMPFVEVRVCRSCVARLDDNPHLSRWRRAYPAWSRPFRVV